MARTAQLDVGDKITYSLSALIRPAPGVRLTVKVAITGRVRRGESGGQAARRIEGLVQNRLNEKVNELMAKTA